MIVQDVIDRARGVLIGFDTKFILDAELLRELSDEQENVIDRTVEGPNQGLPLPGDASDSVTLTPFAASYALPVTAWRLRAVELVRSAGDPSDVQLVAPSQRKGVPPTFPSAYVIGTNIFPIDGVFDGLLASRTYGWESAATAAVDFVTKPVDLTSLAQTMDAPDEARSYLAHWAAVFMATRGHVSQAEVGQITARRDIEFLKYSATVNGFPGRRQFPDA